MQPREPSRLAHIWIAELTSLPRNSDKIGSPGAMYDLLVEKALTHPVKDNAHGSYVTMRSKSGLIFGKSFQALIRG